MKKFRLEDYEGNFAVHVDTEEECDALCKFLDNNGKIWKDGDSYLDCNHWETFKNETCLDFKEGTRCSLDFYRSQGYTILEFSDFDWEKGEMKEFKVGDWVKGKEGSFFENKVLQVVDIVNNNLVFANHEGCLKSYCAELVCGFTKNQEVEISANCEFYTSSWGKFYEYKPSLKKPFLVINKNDDITNWKYCRAAKPKPKYKPYTEPDLKWLGMYLDDEEGNCRCICSVGLDYIVFDNDSYVSFKELLNYKFEGKPFGEEIK